MPVAWAIAKGTLPIVGVTKERHVIDTAAAAAIDAQLEELRNTRDFIEYKCWFYDVAAESGTCDTPRTMPFEELPEDIKRIKAKCRINRY